MDEKRNVAHFQPIVSLEFFVPFFDTPISQTKDLFDGLRYHNPPKE